MVSQTVDVYDTQLWVLQLYLLLLLLLFYYDYLSLEATVINYLHESNMGGPPPSIAPLPTGNYSAPQRVSLTIRDFPTTVPSYILNSTVLPIKLQNNNLVVNGAIYHANYGFNSFIDFDFSSDINPNKSICNKI